MRTEGGDCYQAAGIYFMDASFHFDVDITSVTLVHGTPVLRRPPFEKFGHAWIEYYHPEKGRMVKDVSNGNDVEMPADLYYTLGKIDPEECRRYDFDDLRRWVTETGHWGPWEECDAL